MYYNMIVILFSLLIIILYKLWCLGDKWLPPYEMRALTRKYTIYMLYLCMVYLNTTSVCVCVYCTLLFKSLVSFNVFERIFLCSPILHLDDQKQSKTNGNKKNIYVHFKMQFISTMAKLNFRQSLDTFFIYLLFLWNICYCQFWW